MNKMWKKTKKDTDMVWLTPRAEIFMDAACLAVDAWEKIPGLPFWSELAQTSLNLDHSSYFGLKIGLNFPQNSDLKNIYSK